MSLLPLVLKINLESAVKEKLIFGLAKDNLFTISEIALNSAESLFKYFKRAGVL